MTTNIPQIAFTPAGPVIPTDAAILTGVQADINAAFGGGLNPALTTPQGQLATSNAAAISDKNANIALLINQVDPRYAAGRMQDAIGNIYFLSRAPAKPTSVSVMLTGLAGTVVPINAQAIATDGKIYLNTANVTIPSGGSISATFQCSETGPITCPAGTLSAIYQAIPGWDTIANATDGIVGQDVESRAEFEFRRQQSVALNAKASLPAIYANVFNVPNVLDVYATQNRTDSPVTIGSITLAPHSLYVAVAGGDPNAIAQAIWSKCSVGCNFNGNTSATVLDTSGYNLPYPSYTITWQTPTPLPIYIAATVQNQGTLSNAALTPLIKDAIIAAFNGVDGGQRARIGSTIYASRYYAGVGSVDAVTVVSVAIGTAPNPNGASLAVGIDRVPTLSAANIALTFA